MASTYDQWKTESGYAEKTPEQENEGRDCPVCGGDCAGANPPVYHCPMKEPPLMSSTEKTHTPGPWVQFALGGECVAIMPAGRQGDICAFSQPPSNADAKVMTAAPELLTSLQEISTMFMARPDMVKAMQPLIGFAEKATFDRAAAAIAKATQP